jgi:hypothetical protein
MTCCANGRRARFRRLASATAALALVAGDAQALFLKGEALDTAADWLSWIVLFLVPIIGIVLFWIVHVMPEKIAHKRHHPQRDAIQTLCLLSLVFGGLLWPIAWIWAYTRPVAYKLAYGTDKHEDYFRELEEKAQAGELEGDELKRLRDELEAIEARGGLPPPLARLREDVNARAARPATPVRED